MNNLLSRLRTGLTPTSKAAFGRVRPLARRDRNYRWDLGRSRSLLIQADLGLEVTRSVIANLQKAVRTRGLLRAPGLRPHRVRARQCPACPGRRPGRFHESLFTPGRIFL